MGRGMIRARGKSLQVRVYTGSVGGQSRYAYSVVPWQGSDAATRRAAEKRLTQMQAEVDQGKRNAGPEGTFASLAERWWEVALPNWAPSTADGYRSLLDRHVLPEFGARRARNITTEDIDDFYRRLRAGDLAPATILKIHHSILARALDQGVRWKWLPANPAVGAQVPKLVRDRADPPAPEDVDRLLAAAAKVDADWWLYLRLAVVTGARRGELLALRWSVIDGAEITIRASHVRGRKGRPETRERTKSNRDRSVWIDDGTATQLAAMHTRHLAEARACGAKLHKDGFVFAREPDGAEPWKPDSTYKRFCRLRKRLGLTCTIHDLRHYVATQLLDEGVPLPEVSAILGHSHTGVTATVYAHSVRRARSKAGDIMGRKLAAGPSSSEERPFDAR